MESIREVLARALKALLEQSAESLARDVSDKYPGITPQDAVRIREGLTALLTVESEEEKAQLEAEYKALHAELRKRYRKSGRK